MIFNPEPSPVRTPDPTHLQCAREEIQWLGQIQSHGMLLALSEPSLNVTHVSSNLAEQFGVRSDSILGCSFEQLLGAQQFHSFRTAMYADEGRIATVIRLALHGAPRELQCTGHRQDGLLIVELEPQDRIIPAEFLDIDTLVRLPLAHMESALDIGELSRVAAREMQRLSGFDRVMIYRFDDQWNGEVIAEIAEHSEVSYLGLRFPASDIPPQARALFAVNPFRSIADVSSTPIPILPLINPATGRSLDLTRAILRSASPIHLEYLRNMAVMSSMTVSVVVGDKLWGLIACHHREPRRVNRATRSVSLLFGATFASQIVLRLDNAALKSRLESRNRLEVLVADLESTSRLDAPQLHDPQLLETFAADGMITSIGGVLSRQGATPEYDSLLPMIARLRRLASHGISSSNILLALEPTAASYHSGASGALYIGLDEAATEFLLFVRKEIIETVNWAGDPDRAVTVDAAGHLHPRTSFEAWRETVRGYSKGWSVIDLENASFLRDQLLRLGAARQLAVVNESLNREIAERKRVEAHLSLAQKLESVGRLASGIAHEINTPMQYVSDNLTFLRDAYDGITELLSSWYLAMAALPDSELHAALRLKLDGAAKRADMDFLREEIPKSFDSILEGVTRVTSIVGAMKEFAHPDRNEQAPADINHALGTTILVAAGEYKHTASIHTDFSVLPMVVCNIGEMSQVFLNLIVNAAHAIEASGKDLSTGEIWISTAVIDDEIEIRIADNGCGVAPENLTKLYDPFFTTKEVGRGTGQGLAISYSILVDKHRGGISAKSTVGVGTDFTLRMPIRGRDAVAA